MFGVGTSHANPSLCTTGQQGILAFLKAHVHLSRQFKGDPSIPPPGLTFQRDLVFPVDLLHPSSPLGRRRPILERMALPSGCEGQLRLGLDPARYPLSMSATIVKGTAIDYGPTTRLELSYTANFKRYFLKVLDQRTGVEIELEATRPCHPQELVGLFQEAGIQFRKAFAPKDAPSCGLGTAIIQ